MTSARVKFDRLWGIQPKPKKMRVHPELSTNLDELFRDKDCAFAGVGVPCDVRPARPQLMMRHLDMAKMGIPVRHRMHENMAMPVCDSCKDLFLYLHLKYKTRTRYRDTVRMVLGISTSAAAEKVTAWEDEARKVIDRYREVADGYVATLYPHTRVTNISFGDPVIVDGELVWVDIVTGKGIYVTFSSYVEEL